jgi:hypothetical protein
MLRFRFRIFGLQMGSEPLRICRDYSNAPGGGLKTEPLPESAFPDYDKEPQ